MSPGLQSSLSPLVPLDYAANPPAVLQGQPRQSCVMLCLVVLPLELVASPRLELAGKANRLWTCSRSVTACDGSHTVPGFTPPRVRSILATCNCCSHTAQGLANRSPVPSQEGSPATTRCWNHMHASPVQGSVFIQGTFLVLWESLRNLHPPDMLLQCSSTVKTNLSALASGIKSGASKEVSWRQCKSIAPEMGFILARKNKSGYLFSASLYWIQSSVSQTIFLVYYIFSLITQAWLVWTAGAMHMHSKWESGS